MANKIVAINEEYFGNDKRRRYLKDDFAAVLRGVVLRSVIVEVLKEASVACHNKEEREDGSVVIGDFNPDNAGLLIDILDIYEKGMMVEIRQLLKDDEHGAGGKFIKEIQELTAEDFIDYYKNRKPESVSIPPLLWEDLLGARDNVKGADFIDNHRVKIEEAVDAMVAKAQQFRSKGYYNRVVRNYEAQEFHKDYQPEKYDIREEPFEFGFLNGRRFIKRPKSRVEIQVIAESLNDFATIVGIYQKLVSNTDFYVSFLPLDAYIEKAFAIFSKKVSSDIKKGTVHDIIKYLHKSINIVGWTHGGLGINT